MTEMAGTTKQEETEAADFRFSILIFGEQIKICHLDFISDL